jgi:hypothetical protein
VTLTYAIGDATVPTVRPAIVVHVVNDVGRFGAGFAGVVAQRWPAAKADYCLWHAQGFELATSV